jgi:hypothetical protein
MPANKLTTLAALLLTASSLVEDLTNLSDPLLGRLARVFARMPAEDREPILTVLEREIEMRLLTRSGDPTLTGYELIRPNPAARLYVRSFGSEAPYLDRDLIMRAALRVARMILLAPASELPEWEAATVEAFRSLSPMERAAISRHHREMLALLERTEPQTPAKAS